MTGSSVVTTLGHHLPDVWSRLHHGDSDVRHAGHIEDFDPTQHLSLERRSLRRMDRFAQLAMVAAQKAFDQAGSPLQFHAANRCGTIIGSCFGGASTIETQHTRLRERGPERVSAFLIPSLMINSASGNIAVHWSLKGPSCGLSATCASGLHAIGTSFRMIQSGAANVMVCGGAEAPLCETVIAGLTAMGWLSSDDAADEESIAPAEGAGLLVLEDFESASRRGANILAEIIGFAMTSDAADIVMPSKAGAARAIAGALRDGNIAKERVGYINAHGTGTAANDKTECAAVADVFGPHADALMISSTKSMHGHLIGGTGAVELLACIMALTDGIIAPTIGYQEQDPECALDVVPNEAREAAVDVVMSNAFAFGGLNAV